LAAVTIGLQQREEEGEMKEREIEELVGEHDRIVKVEEARGQVEELRDVSASYASSLPQYSTHFTFKFFSQVLAEREAEFKELRLNISEDDLHEKFEQALAHLEQESDEKDGGIAANNEEIQKLWEQVCALEEENDRIREEFERVRGREGEA
jgi:polyhydroxyalkanoate synthesis regulator phasin